jgi:putative phosphoribosyl transferase
MMRFKNRTEAGQLLATALESVPRGNNSIVLALPRGGVPVAYEVASRYHLPLDVFLVRKLGVPGQEELALGAIASGGLRVLNEEVIAMLDISVDQIEQVTKKEEVEIQRRDSLYRPHKPPIDVAGKTVILIDDGLATGSTMLAALRALKTQKPTQLIAAVPVAPPDTLRHLRLEADEVHCLLTPEPFFGVGLWYQQFDQTCDEEVLSLLNQAANAASSSAS